MVINTEAQSYTNTFYSGNYSSIIDMKLNSNQRAMILDAQNNNILANTVTSKIEMNGYNENIKLLIVVSNKTDATSSWAAGITDIKNIQTEIDKALSGGGGGGGVELPVVNIPSQLDAVVSINNAPIRKQVLATTVNRYPVRGMPDKTVHVVIGSELADITGQVCINAGGYIGDVMLLCWDIWGAAWLANTFYKIGDIIHPPVERYPELGCVYRCITQGYGGAVEPAWWPYSHSNAEGAIGDAGFIAEPYLAPQVQGPFQPYTQEVLSSGNIKINGIEYQRGFPVMFGDISVYPFTASGKPVIYRRVDNGKPFNPIVSTYSA